MPCQICKKQSGYYPLCTEHFKEKDEGKIIKCETCNTWHYITEKCQCKDKQHTTISNNELKCIVCGNESNEKHFCKTCYMKYKDRAVDLRITNCNETQILDEYGNLNYKCADGRKVRSRAEMIINDFFFHNKIRIVYEQTVYYKEDNEDKQLHPDFYLPDFNLYIEYNEIANPSYKKKTEYVQKIYKSINKNVIIMTDDDLKDIATFLKPRLGIN